MGQRQDMQHPDSHRAGEVIFGVVALVGPGLIAAVITGSAMSAVVLLVMPLAVIGWSAYYWFVVRPTPAAPSSRHKSSEHLPDVEFPDTF